MFVTLLFTIIVKTEKNETINCTTIIEHTLYIIHLLNILLQLCDICRRHSQYRILSDTAEKKMLFSCLLYWLKCVICLWKTIPQMERLYWTFAMCYLLYYLNNISIKRNKTTLCDIHESNIHIYIDIIYIHTHIHIYIHIQIYVYK